MSSMPLSELLKLDPARRAELALALWESLSEAERGSNFDLTPDEAAELDRRWSEHLKDPGSAVPWEVVSRRLDTGE
jgi:putative addiction module component (TIGR02574 family)